MPYEIMALPLGLLVCFIIGVECSHSQLDRIAQLPGQPPVWFQQYSGYVTVDDKNHKALFYYFAEAERDCASKPLVLWLNGGPGCSSLGVGAFSENGPFRPSGEGLVKNQYSWNREANMLYLETPIGVGFSYSTNTSSYEGVDDKITARDNLVFLQKWFVKFPQYRNRSLFITGESYAGGVFMLKTNFFSSQSKQVIINSNCTNNSYCTNSARTNADFMQDADFMQEAITAKTWNEESMQERISCNNKGNMLGNDNSLRQQNPHDNEESLNHGMKIVSNGNNNKEEENPADDI